MAKAYFYYKYQLGRVVNIPTVFCYTGLNRVWPISLNHTYLCSCTLVHVHTHVYAHIHTNKYMLCQKSTSLIIVEEILSKSILKLITNFRWRICTNKWLKFHVLNPIQF